jgi:membrane protein DedA with SNARE-associated domain
VAHLLDPLIAFVADHARLAYLTLFLAALLEAIPLLGSVIPGTTVILALSALIPGGELELQWVLAAAIIGAVIGDGGAFWVGHQRQRDILTAWPFSNYPKLVAQSEAFFHRFGTLAIFLARFVAPIRAVVPITAGALDIAPARFYAVNIPAVVLWACAHVLPGVFAVELLHRYGGIPHHSHIAKHTWIAAAIIGTIIVWLVLRMLRKRREGHLAASS